MADQSSEHDAVSLPTLNCGICVLLSRATCRASRNARRCSATITGIFCILSAILTCLQRRRRIAPMARLARAEGQYGRHRRHGEPGPQTR